MRFRPFGWQGGPAGVMGKVPPPGSTVSQRTSPKGWTDLAPGHQETQNEFPETDFQRTWPLPQEIQNEFPETDLGCNWLQAARMLKMSLQGRILAISYKAFVRYSESYKDFVSCSESYAGNRVYSESYEADRI